MHTGPVWNYTVPAAGPTCARTAGPRPRCRSRRRSARLPAGARMPGPRSTSQRCQPLDGARCGPALAACRRRAASDRHPSAGTRRPRDGRRTCSYSSGLRALCRASASKVAQVATSPPVMSGSSRSATGTSLIRAAALVSIRKQAITATRQLDGPVRPSPRGLPPGAMPPAGTVQLRWRPAAEPREPCPRSRWCAVHAALERATRRPGRSIASSRTHPSRRISRRNRSRPKVV